MRYPLIALFVMICALHEPASHAAEPSLLDETVYRLQMGNQKDVMFLVEKLGNPNSTDRAGWPLLAIAASRTDQEAMRIVKALVDAGADINFGGANNFYPIIYAVQNNNLEIVKYLLDSGANYRVTDAHGMRLVDYARQSGNREITRMIEEAVDNDILNLARMRSPGNRDEQTYQLAYNACALQYYSFYYHSKQDPIPEAEQQKTLGIYKKKVSDSMGELVAIFKIPSRGVTEVYQESQAQMFSELEGLISNRWRRQKGVGQDGDMDARCSRIAEPWKKGHFDAN